MAKQTAKEKEVRTGIINKFKVSGSDTGSAEVQVALLTTKINELTEHLKAHKKDFSSQRGLMKAVGARRSMLDYLKKVSSDRYLKLINALELRK